MSHKKGLKRKAYKTFKANTEKEEKYVPQMITPMPESQKKKRTKMQNRGYANWFDIDGKSITFKFVEPTCGEVDIVVTITVDVWPRRGGSVLSMSDS